MESRRAAAGGTLILAEINITWDRKNSIILKYEHFQVVAAIVTRQKTKNVNAAVREAWLW